MRLFSLISGCVAIILSATHASADVITFSDLHKDKTLGVHVHPTGPTDLPFAPGWIEVYGQTADFLNDSAGERFYSGRMTFDTPATSITFDVTRASEGGWGNTITLIGKDDNHRVAARTITLMPMGDLTQVTVSSPLLTEVDWHGTNWAFHPYVIRDVHVTFAPLTSSPHVTPDVGSPIPEPGSCGAMICAAAGLLLRRTRSAIAPAQRTETSAEMS